MLKCMDPATGDVIERICCDDRRTVHRMYRKLQQGQRQWRDNDWHHRLEVLEQFGQLLGDERIRLVEGLTGEVGTPVEQARAEVDAARRRIDEFVDAGTEAMGVDVLHDEAPQTGREVVEREPLGVVAHISTWSAPLLVGVEALAPALLAGNAVLYKPSEEAALLGRQLVELLWDAGFPDDVVDVAIGGGAVGDYVLDESIAGVSFAGSYNTGQMVAQKLATRMIPQHLELGTKDGAYVCDDVDVEPAAHQIAEIALYNSGRGRRALDRVYVHESLHRRFVESLCRQVDSFRLGDPATEGNLIGPIIDDRRLRTLEYQMSDAIQKGATLLMGGRAHNGQGHFFEPTVITDVDHRMLVMREESPGPVVAIQRVCDDAEALHRLGDSDYRGGAAVLSASRERARRLLMQIDAESVYWSDCSRGETGRVRPRGLDVAGVTEELRRVTRPKNWRLGSGPQLVRC